MSVASIRTKIRALIGDFNLKRFDDPEVFTYEGVDSFVLCESNITSIISVTINDGSPLGSGEYTFDSDTNTLELTSGVAVVTDDIIKVQYNYSKYSDSELAEYIRASLVWLSIYAYKSASDFELESEIYPTPNSQEQDMIALIASILIKPDYSKYSIPNTLTVTYPRKMSKEERIEELIKKFKKGIGVSEVIEWDIFRQEI